jgi:TctA family transporter
MSEANLRRFMQIDDGQFWRLFTKPICVVFVTLALASMITAVINQRKINKRLEAAEKISAEKLAEASATK